MELVNPIILQFNIIGLIFCVLKHQLTVGGGDGLFVGDGVGESVRVGVGVSVGADVGESY